MAGSTTYTVRPFSKPQRTDGKDLFRIYLSPARLVLHDFHVGDICRIQSPNNLAGDAIIYQAPEKIQDSLIQTSKTLQALYGLKLGDKVSLSHRKGPLPDASVVSLSEDTQETVVPLLDQPHKVHWAWLLERVLENAEFLSPGMTLDRVEAGGQRRSFRVLEINSSRDPALYRAQPNCKIKFVEQTPHRNNADDRESKLALVDTDGVGGLTQQFLQINEVIAEYIQADEQCQMVGPGSWPGFREGGILLHGLAGTGKSIALRKICNAGWSGIFHINSSGVGRASENINTIKKAFSDARQCQPSLIVMDNLESLAGRPEQAQGRANSVCQTLCEELDQLGSARTLVIGATRALTDIDQDLRQPERFAVEIEIPIPDSKSRFEILKVLRGLPKDAADTELEEIASKSHGFVGSDLKKLLSLAARKARTRVRASQVAIGENLDKSDQDNHVSVTDADLYVALREVRPTAMREIFVETPRVRWSDIGGQERVKKNLEKAVIWPLREPHDMARLGIAPRRGLLLYGPPGCSKTMTAKAIATESGLNFITVKGAELLNMYVGESERAVRKLFSRARAVSPSIIFFDEIDAIGGTRDGGQHGGVQIGTTLLNELDGVQELKGVFVLAATNRPELVDAALTRPGRLDTMLYVGPPDTEAREYILSKRLEDVDCGGDVDLSELAIATEGYSGAELVSICHRAGEAAFEDQLNTHEQQKVSRGHFSKALEEVQKNITPKMIASYERFAAARR